MHADPERRRFNGRALLFLEQSMGEWVFRGPALPVMIPWPRVGMAVQASARDFAERLDGLILQGGVDVAPESYGETPLRPEWAGDGVRDAYEMELISAFMALEKPVLGICRGHQILNVALGGSLYQDIETQVPGALRHRDAEIYHENAHAVRFVAGSLLAELYGRREARINSVHHQAIKELAPGLLEEAHSPVDGVIEAARWTGSSFAYGVQWHPEFQEARQADLLSTEPLMTCFLEAVEARRRGGE